MTGNLRHISTLPWWRRWWHRVYCLFAFRKSRKLMRDLSKRGVHNTPHPRSCACGVCCAVRADGAIETAMRKWAEDRKKLECQHRNVTRDVDAAD